LYIGSFSEVKILKGRLNEAMVLVGGEGEQDERGFVEEGGDQEIPDVLHQVLELKKDLTMSQRRILHASNKTRRDKKAERRFLE